MQEISTLMGVGYNYLLPTHLVSSPRLPEKLEAMYELETHRRAIELIESDKLDALEMDEYPKGNCTFEQLYAVAFKQAQADLADDFEYRELERVGYEY